MYTKSLEFSYNFYKIIKIKHTCTVLKNYNLYLSLEDNTSSTKLFL